MTPPKKAPSARVEVDDIRHMSILIKGVTTRKLLKRIKEEGKDVWIDER